MGFLNLISGWFHKTRTTMINQTKICHYSGSICYIALIKAILTTQKHINTNPQCRTVMRKCRTVIRKVRTVMRKCRTAIRKVRIVMRKCRTVIRKVRTVMLKCRTVIRKCRTVICKVRNVICKVKGNTPKKVEPLFGNSELIPQNS